MLTTKHPYPLKNAIKLFKEAEGGIIVLQQSAVQTYFVALALFYRRKSRLYLMGSIFVIRKQ